MTTKLCRKCNNTKALSDFYKISGQNKHGVTSQCKVCIKSRNRRNYVVYKSKHDDRIKLRNKNYHMRIKTLKKRDSLISNMNYEHSIQYIENHHMWTDTEIYEFLIKNQLKPKLSFKDSIYLIEDCSTKKSHTAKKIPKQVKKVFDFITTHEIQNNHIDDFDYIEPNNKHLI
jgi:hypothetical protein